MSEPTRPKPQPEGRAGYKAFRTITTRWMDNDAYGHVNNVVYYSWFDTVVNAHLIEQGALDIHHGETIGLVIETQCNYFAPWNSRRRWSGPAGGEDRQVQRPLRGGPVPRGRAADGGQGPLRPCLRGPRHAPSDPLAATPEGRAGPAPATVRGRSRSVDAAIASRFPAGPSPRAALPRATVEEPRRSAVGHHTQPCEGAARDALVEAANGAPKAMYADPRSGAGVPRGIDTTDEGCRPISTGAARTAGAYGLLGIAKGEKDRMHAQHQRNFRFFDAPVGPDVHTDRVAAALMDYGMFLENVMLAARARGPGRAAACHTCPQAAWNGFAKIIPPHVGAGEGEMLCAVWVAGLRRLDAHVNTFARRGSRRRRSRAGSKARLRSRPSAAWRRSGAGLPGSRSARAQRNCACAIRSARGALAHRFGALRDDFLLQSALADSTPPWRRRGRPGDPRMALHLTRPSRPLRLARRSFWSFSGWVRTASAVRRLGRARRAPVLAQLPGVAFHALQRDCAWSYCSSMRALFASVRPCSGAAPAGSSGAAVRAAARQRDAERHGTRHRASGSKRRLVGRSGEVRGVLRSKWGLCTWRRRLRPWPAHGAAGCVRALVAPAGDDVEAVVGQLAPLFLDLALQLLPASLDAVLVHRVLPLRRPAGRCCMPSWRAPCSTGRKPEAAR